MPWVLGTVCKLCLESLVVDEIGGRLLENAMGAWHSM